MLILQEKKRGIKKETKIQRDHNQERHWDKNFKKIPHLHSKAAALGFLYFANKSYKIWSVFTTLRTNQEPANKFSQQKKPANKD